MLKRTITGIALIAVLVVVLLLLPAWCTAVLLAAMVILDLVVIRDARLRAAITKIICVRRPTIFRADILKRH